MEKVTLLSNESTLSKASPEEIQALIIEGLRKPDNWKAREAYFRQEFMVKGLVRGQEYAVQNVHTPFVLAEEMVRKLHEYLGAYPKDLKILVYNIEFLDILYRLGILWNNEVWFVNENPVKVQFAKDIYVGDDNDKFETKNWLTWETDMKFDVIVGNPPFNGEVSHKERGQNKNTIWPDFVTNMFSLLKENGYLCVVHPSAWRNRNKSLENITKLIQSKAVQYLELHNSFDGVETFGVQTSYDWYVAKNCPSQGITTIKGEDGKIYQINLNDFPIIPNGMFSDIKQLIAKDNEKRVRLIRDASTFHTQKPWMRKEKAGKFQYPCIYTTDKIGNINYWYSSKNDESPFGIPKVFWSNGSASTVHVDRDGSFGLTEYAYAITCDSKQLDNVKKAMESKKFLEIMKYCDLGNRHRYN